MRRRLAARSALVFLLLTAVALAGPGAGPAPPPGAPVAASAPARPDPALADAVAAALIAGEPHVSLRLTTLPADAAGVASALAGLGAQTDTDLADAGYLAATVPAAHALQAAMLPGVLAASLGGAAQLPDPAGLAAALLPPGDAVPAASAGEAVPAQTSARRFQPQRGLLPTREALGLPASGPTGQGVTIALIDTGADLGLDALARSPDGTRKVVDYADFSGEGDVPIPVSAAPNASGQLTTPAGVYQVPRGLSKSGRYRFGLWREDSLPPGSMLRDLNRNGRLGDQFGVLLIDSQQAGVYDTVLVDTNGNKDFTDETRLRAYRQRQDIGVLGPRDAASPALQLHFVVTDVAADGTRVTFGFDGHGHGTQVAAVAGGNPAETGLRGVAPGASLMILKAIDSSGSGDWDNIARAMIYAAQNGADVVSLSLATSDGRRGGLAAETQLMMSLSRIHDVLFIEAAGNNGPGLASAASPGEGTDVVTVGAWLSESMWRDYYGYPVGRPGIAVYSAVGPRLDGSLSPTLVAPGTAFAPAPHWLGTGGRQLIEGTSIATPQVAGGAALVIEAMRTAGVNPHYRLVKQALEQSARPLPGYQAVEQGLGALRVDQALALVSRSSAVPIADVTLQGTREGARGLLTTGLPPGHQRFIVADLSGLGLNLSWRTSADWLQPDLPKVALPPRGSRTVTVDYDLPPEPGLYSGIMVGEDARYIGTEARALTTVVQPYEFTPANDHEVVFRAGVSAAQYQRTFLRVPEGIDALNLSIRVPRDAGDRPLGRLRLYVVGPDHHTLIAPQTVGVDEQGGSDAFFYQVISPIAGVWEVIAYSLPDLAQHGLQVSFFEFEASLSGVVFPQGTLHLAPSAGVAELETSVTVRSLDRQFAGRLIGAGFGSSPAGAGGERITLHEGQAAVRRLPEVGRDALWLRVSLSNPTVAGTALNVTLYRLDPVTKAPIQVQARYFRSVENPVIELTAPPPGEYYVMMEGTGLGGQGVQYQYRTEIIADTGDLLVDDPGRVRLAGETWTVPVTMRLPEKPGRYYGRFMVYDDENQRMIGTLPVVLDLGKPRLSVRVLPLYAGLAQAATGAAPVGASQALTLEVRDAASGRIVDVPVAIDGRLYYTLDGQVRLPLRDGVGQAPQALQVVIDVSSHARFEQAVTVPAPRLAPDPAREQEFSRQREKIADQQRQAAAAPSP